MVRDIKKFNESINDALDICLKEDKSVIVCGLGSDDPKRIFETTNKLVEKYGRKRVFDLPTSENGTMGILIGAAVNGLRPIISHQRVEFALLAFEQIVNQATKWSFMSNGKMNVPIVIRLIVGRGWGQGSQHSQSLESVFAHFPGLKVVAPSNAYDAKGLLASSVKDNNPVIYYEHRWLHNTTSRVPKKMYFTKIGKAKILKKGSDITIVTFSYMCLEALKAQKILQKYKIYAEIIDLVTIKPLDIKTILNSVKKTRRVVIVDNGWCNFGISAEVISLIYEKKKFQMKHKPVRIGINYAPIASTRALSQYSYPTVNDILKNIEKIFKLKINKNDLVKFKLEQTDVPDKSFSGPF